MDNRTTAEKLRQEGWYATKELEADAVADELDRAAAEIEQLTESRDHWCAKATKAEYELMRLRIQTQPTKDRPIPRSKSQERRFAVQLPQSEKDKIDPDGCKHGITWNVDCGWCFQEGEER